MDAIPLILFVVMTIVVISLAVYFWGTSRDRQKQVHKQPPVPESSSISIFDHTPAKVDSASLSKSQFGVEIVTLKGNPHGVPKTGDRFQFQHEWLTIGREYGNDIVIDGVDLVSRYHATVTIDGKAVVLTDLKSTNGTWLNGERVMTTAVLDLKLPFQIGPCLFALAKVGEKISRRNSSPALKSGNHPITKADVSAISTELDLAVTHQIGSGGAATVYLCRDRDGENVALKLLNRHADQYFKEKFRHEIEIGRRISHPQIVEVLSSGYATPKNIPYILMEYMAGGSLATFMEKHPIIQADEMVNIVGQICDGLQHAHNQKIFHRDIKPENILIQSIDDVGRVSTAKVADFGIAKLTESTVITRDGSLIGTPHYMSYEQAKALSIDHRSDQYAVGILMYRMLTGQLPFDGSPLDIVRQHIVNEPVNPTKLNPAINPEIEAIVLKTLQKDREQRFASMVELAAALKRAVQLGSAEMMMPQKIRLLLGLDGTTQEIDISDPKLDLVIGRTLFRDTPGPVSRQHARLFEEDGAVWIEDLNSANGTYLNGEIVRQAVLLPPDAVVEFGPIRMKFIQE